MFLELVHISVKDDQRDLTIDYRLSNYAKDVYYMANNKNVFRSK